MLYLAMQCSWLLELLHFWFSIWRHPSGIWRDPSGIWRHPSGIWRDPSGFWRDPSGCAFCLNQDKSQLQFLFFPQREGVSLCAVWNTMGAIVCCFNEANKLKNRRFLCRTIVLTRTQCAKTHTRTHKTSRLVSFGKPQWANTLVSEVRWFMTAKQSKPQLTNTHSDRRKLHECKYKHKCKHKNAVWVRCNILKGSTRFTFYSISLLLHCW